MSKTVQKNDQRNLVAVYAGTFDPMTNGHRDIVERAIKVFDKVIFAVAESSSKSPLFSASERVELAKECLSDLGDLIEVKSFRGLLVEFVKNLNAHVIIRGLRAVSDYEYESQMAVINRELNADIETVFLMTSKRSSFISSSIVKQVASVGGEISGLVPAPVATALKRKFG
jgi:pantetheine-phosphate adenylyltransferase